MAERGCGVGHDVPVQPAPDIRVILTARPAVRQTVHVRRKMNERRKCKEEEEKKNTQNTPQPAVQRSLLCTKLSGQHACGYVETGQAAVESAVSLQPAAEQHLQ